MPCSSISTEVDAVGAQGRREEGERPPSALLRLMLRTMEAVTGTAIS